MERLPGSYALIFKCEKRSDVKVGSLGILRLEPGYYAYVGSAFGPGGVSARINHHRQISQRPHWHLDYLRSSFQLVEYWYTNDPRQREHQWAAQLSVLRGVRQPFAGFGASDCDCHTHLFRLGFKPSFDGFRRRIRKKISSHGQFYRVVVESGTPEKQGEKN